ncbi:DUF6194 family protein [Jannaschia faecimaris]|nr:DUF6194 family protein [Jannaschia faecimaris]
MTKWNGIESVHEYLVTTLSDVVPKPAWGETSYFYNPGLQLKSGTYFATIKERDSQNDNASALNRPGVWRLNIGVSKKCYLSHFGPPPPRPGKGGVVEGPWDFTALDRITPHPIYRWMSWIAVLSPTAGTWVKCQTLLADAHSRAQITFERRLKSLDRE